VTKFASIIRPVALILGLVLISAGACRSRTGEQEEAEEPAAQPDVVQARTFFYQCEDGFQFTARLEGDTLQLFLPDQTVELPRVPSESGDRFSDGRVSLWSGDGQARLEMGPEMTYRCRNDPFKAVWEHARLNGVDFRAVGNEPGWQLEIYEGEKIVFITDYGTARYTFAAPQPEVDAAARTTTYRIRDRNHVLIVVTEGRPCSDTMREEEFEATVTVTLDARRLTGCGRALR
jgi:membrane-bound inhibitor of C-type lysozyme/uncharacterized membrane protein